MLSSEDFRSKLNSFSVGILNNEFGLTNCS